MLLRNFSVRGLAAIALFSLTLPLGISVSGQEPRPAGAPPDQTVRPQPAPVTVQNQIPAAKVQIDGKTITAEMVVEAAILANGGREIFAQIRRNGLERGKRFLDQREGKPIEADYERRFKRGETSDKDQLRMDQRIPVAYALIYANNESWGILNNTTFSPRVEIVRSFHDQLWHNLDALFRYKEDGSTITLVGKEKHGGVEVYVVDLSHKAKLKSEAGGETQELQLSTRYFISVRLLRVLWLEYSDTATGTPVKWMRRFYDYKVAQGTLVPYRSVLSRDGERVEETNVLTVTYGIKLDDSVFAKI